MADTAVVVVPDVLRYRFGHPLRMVYTYHTATTRTAAAAVMHVSSDYSSLAIGNDLIELLLLLSSHVFS